MLFWLFAICFGLFVLLVFLLFAAVLFADDLLFVCWLWLPGGLDLLFTPGFCFCGACLMFSLWLGLILVFVLMYDGLLIRL